MRFRNRVRTLHQAVKPRRLSLILLLDSLCPQILQPDGSPFGKGMNSMKLCSTNFVRVFITIATALWMAGASAFAQNVQHLTTTHPGGMPGLPVLTGVERDTNGFRVTWDGPPGYYQLYRKLGEAGSQWTPIGGANITRRATISISHSNAFFRVAGPAPRYAGSQACLECHENLHNSVMDTRHARAFESLKKVGQDKNPGCLACHTVGHGLPTGFVSEAQTPHLAGVQCENCHGPAAHHAANDMDRTLRPRVELAGAMCGGCHTGTHHSWKTSGHAAEVVQDMNASSRINSCAQCHSAPARINLLKDDLPPVGHANLGISCVACHEPHHKTSHPAQLRNPIASSADFFVNTSEQFAANYNPSINICAQCHNHRGASWTSSSRPPHYSPQYNMLLGTVGELPPGSPPGRSAGHARLIEKQCVGCHMPSMAHPIKSHPAISSHSFKVESFDSCRSCHPLPELLTQFTSGAISSQIQEIKAALDLWAIKKASASLRAKYGVRAWEYTTPGKLSPGGPGPDSAEQALIPEPIKKARFNLYLVLHDGSYGVHNGPHSVALLQAAREWVRQEVNRP
jgi:hypothetical protein